MYEIGKIYIWQGQTGEMKHLNGTECQVLEAEPQRYWCLLKKEWFFGQATDTPGDSSDGAFYFAEPGDLRLKNPPAGEQSIRDLFKLPELAEA